MAWGIGVGIMIMAVLFLVFAFIMFKETRTHRFWQTKVDEGDVEMIRQLIQVEMERWSAERPPKGMPATVWQGIQNAELVEVGPEHVRVSSSAEPQFALVGGERQKVSSALAGGKGITAALAERCFYDVPHVRPKRVQIDIYTTSGEVGGEATQRCILSTVADRAVAADVDWDAEPPDVIAERLGARYRLDDTGSALPIDPDKDSPEAAGTGPARDGPMGGRSPVL